MATKQIDIQQNLVIADSIENPEAGYIGFGAKEDGLYQKIEGEDEKKLLIEDDLPTLGTIAVYNLWTGTQAAYDAIVTKLPKTIYLVEET